MANEGAVARSNIPTLADCQAATMPSLSWIFASTLSLQGKLVAGAMLDHTNKRAKDQADRLRRGDGVFDGRGLALTLSMVSEAFTGMYLHVPPYTSMYFHVPPASHTTRSTPGLHIQGNGLSRPKDVEVCKVCMKDGEHADTKAKQREQKALSLSLSLSVFLSWGIRVALSLSLSLPPSVPLSFDL